MFKYKPDKLKNQEKIRTLDETHRNYIKTFEQARTSLDVKKQRLVFVTDKLKRLNSSDQSVQTPDNVKLRSALKDEINRLTREIDDITHNTSELDYYSKIDNILLRYYDIIDNTDKDSSPSQQTHMPQQGLSMSDQLVSSQHKSVRKRSRTQQSAQKNILCFFEGSKETQTTEPREQSDKSPVATTNSDSIRDTHYVLPKNRAFLHEQYMNAINNGSHHSTKRLFNTAKFCENCKLERTLVQSEGIYVCGNCGEAECALIESDIPNYKDSFSEKPVYPYKRLNWLEKRLNYFLIIMIYKN